MKTSKYTMEITTIMSATPTVEYLENLITAATGDTVNIIKEL